MRKYLVDSYYLTCLALVLISLSMTPWMNSDSLVIPKLIIFFSATLYLLPRLFLKSFSLQSLPYFKVVYVVSALILLQLLLVMFLSNAPYEQQIFGRTGRGLGLMTEFSFLVFMIISMRSVNFDKLKFLFGALFLAGTATSIYSIFQWFGLDIFEWITRTNGIIGTLGNPNFQSAFATMVLFPILVLFKGRQQRILLTLIALAPIILLIYLSESTQGYLILAATILIYALLYTWYKNRLFFYVIFSFSGLITSVVVMGILNYGPLSQYLYKISVQSRGEFYRTAIAIANQNPFFGVGIDSLGDYYLMYRDEKAARGIGEFADNAHNIFLNHAATGGYPLMIIYLVLMALVLFCFIKYVIRSQTFDVKMAALFCAWSAYQLQSLVNPANVSMVAINAVLSGSIVGLSSNMISHRAESKVKNISKLKYTSPFSNLLLVISLIICYPYFNVDRLALLASNTGNGELALESATAYPESVLRYSRIGQDFIKSNLAPQALEIARSAVQFNPDAVSAWGLLLVNNLATLEERNEAKRQILRLDPFNKDVANLVIPDVIEPQNSK